MLITTFHFTASLTVSALFGIKRCVSARKHFLGLENDQIFLTSVRGVDVTARNQVGFKAVSITIRERQARPVVVPAARAGTDKLTSENLY